MKKTLQKKMILDNNFIRYNKISDLKLSVLSSSESVYFFDTENSPIFPLCLTKKYNLTEVEYDTIDVFKDTSKDSFLNKLIKHKKITTGIYVWQFGNQLTNDVYWGNTIEEFIEFIGMIDNHRIENNEKPKQFEIYVHNISWDIEFFKYFFKEKNYTQIRIDPKNNRKKKPLQFTFDIIESEGITQGATINLEMKTCEIGIRKKKQLSFVSSLQFKDSAKITPMSLKTISEKMIKVDDIYIKNSDVYKYNTVRDITNYVPTDVESWYIYCDIYLLKEWYNQFVKVQYIDNGISPYTISQIAFDSILKKTYDDGELREKYKLDTDKKELTDRQIYERHFELNFIEKNPLIKEYIRLSYKGGHTTASDKYTKIGEQDLLTFEANKNLPKEQLNSLRKPFIIKGVSVDITSSYPSQMNLKPLPFGKPVYNRGKYKNFIYDCESENEKIYDFHFITIAFDGFTSKVKGNQFGLNVKLRGLTEEQKTKLGTSTNESATHNIIDGVFVGNNRIKVENKKRKKLIDKCNRNFIITVPFFEYEEYMKNFDFYCGGKKQVEFIDYLSFQSEVGHYEKGINHFFKVKEENDGDYGNVALKENAKLIINSFYGKHCSRRDREQRFYDFTKDIICFQKVTEENENVWEDAKCYAVHYGSAVTSYGRVQLRETCRLIGSDKFIYADTDSLKFEISKDSLIKISKERNIQMSFKNEDKRLGAWDFEYSFDDFKAVGQKKYMYKKEGKEEFTTKCAGLPSSIRDQIKQKEDFGFGKVFNKKAKRKVVGGNLLIDISYSISELLRC